MNKISRIIGLGTLMVMAIMISLFILETVVHKIDTKQSIIKRPAWLNLRNEKIWSCFTPDSTAIYRPSFNEKGPNCPITDDEGYRLNPFVVDKRENNLIIALGDSFTWGHGADEAGAYPSQLQILLNDAGVPARVLNAGFPGYGTDQELIFVEHYILPSKKPRVVVWNINENDWIDNNEACLYTVKQNQLEQHSGKLNTLYLLSNLYRHSPKFITNTKLYWLLFSSVPERVTLGCSKTNANEANEDAKVALEIARMKRHGEVQNFRLIVTYVQGQYGYELDPPEDYRLSTERKLNAIRSAGVEPVIISQSIQSLIHSEEKTLGESGESLSSLLFLDSDPFPYGQKHMNELGNKLFAKVVFQALLGDHLF